jgi:hypothetical protein
MPSAATLELGTRGPEVRNCLPNGLSVTSTRMSTGLPGRALSAIWILGIMFLNGDVKLAASHHVANSPYPKRRETMFLAQALQAHAGRHAHDERPGGSAATWIGSGARLKPAGPFESYQPLRQIVLSVST